MFDFICITCIFDRLCSQINDDDEQQTSNIVGWLTIMPSSCKIPAVYRL